MINAQLLIMMIEKKTLSILKKINFVHKLPTEDHQNLASLL